MKKFRFKFSTLVWVLLFVVLLLSFAGLGFNIFNLVNYIPKGAGKILIYSIMIMLIIFLIAMDLSIMIFGSFIINDDYLIARFGIVKTKFKIKDITAIILHKKDNKLVVYEKENKYLVIVINQSEYDDFVLFLRKKNKSIIYDVKEKDIDPV